MLGRTARAKGLFQSHKDRKRKSTSAISVLDVLIGDRSSFFFHNILQIIKNAHSSCLSNNELKEGAQAYENWRNAFQSYVSLTSVIQA